MKLFTNFTSSTIWLPLNIVGNKVRLQLWAFDLFDALRDFAPKLRSYLSAMILQNNLTLSPPPLMLAVH